MMAQALALSLAEAGFDARVAQLEGDGSVVEQAVRLRPALVLLDLGLDGSDGLDLVAGLRATGARVLVVTAESDESRMAAAVARGACGWVSKAEPFENLLEAARLALRDRPLLDLEAYDDVVQAGRACSEADRELKSRFATLTGREREVLEALRDGKSAQDIAGEWYVSVGTIRCHIRAILVKLGVTSQLAAVAQVGELLPPRRRKAAGRWRPGRRRLGPPSTRGQEPAAKTP
jgi:DNA-binding NarL/FixJ family response regulator